MKAITVLYAEQWPKIFGKTNFGGNFIDLSNYNWSLEQFLLGEFRCGFIISENLATRQRHEIQSNHQPRSTGCHFDFPEIRLMSSDRMAFSNGLLKLIEFAA